MAPENRAVFETLILAPLALPIASALYHWAWFRQELRAMRWLDERAAGKVASTRPPRRKPPTKAESQRAIKLAACERKWRRRLTVASH